MIQTCKSDDKVNFKLFSYLYYFSSVYDDVPTAFKEWTDSGKKIYVYSSGSVLAQKLLFGDSVHGDLTKVNYQHEKYRKMMIENELSNNFPYI